MNSIEAVAGVIQLAVAPVFLLAGIAGLLGVLSTRLARIVDRARVIERRIPQAKRDEQRTLLRRETTVLWRRIALINWAIRLCVSGDLVAASGTGQLSRRKLMGDRNAANRRRCR